MILTADYHTHTDYSEGNSTIEENVARAKELGMKEIALTEHGFSHVFFGLKRRELDGYIKKLRAAEKAVGIPVLMGMESNIRGVSGLCDVTEHDYEKFDIFLAGVHIVIHYETRADRRLVWKSYRMNKRGRTPSAEHLKEMTRLYINAIEKNPIDILTHLNFHCCANAVEVAKCCRDNGTYLEISSKKTHLTDDELAACAATGVRFVINSDAHTSDRIGDTAIAAEQIARVGIPLSQIDNIDGRMPTFRFAEYKKHM